MKKPIIIALALFTVSLLACEEDPFMSNSTPSLAPAISIYSFYPEQGKGGDEIAITGENFGKLIGDNYVTFDATGSEIVRFEPGVITVRVPATLTPGDYNIFLSANGSTVGAKKAFRVMDAIAK